MATIKGGEAAFKTDADGPMFNAYSSINETFKQIEDALNVATPNLQVSEVKPQSADSGANSQATGSNLSNTPKPIRIGVNCGADDIFNKDPKDPNKYEVEGAKGVQSTQ